MTSQVSRFDHYGLEVEILQTRDELTLLQNSLEKSEKAWAASEMTLTVNPIAVSLNADISDHLALLKRFERALAISEQ
jgi:hypothetical protein